MRNAVPTFACLLVAVAIFAGGTGCGTTRYMKATGAFAKSAAVGTAALVPVFNTASILCRRRAQIDYLTKRLEGGNKVDGNAYYWRDLSKTGRILVAQADGTTKEQTWADHCEQIAKGDTLLLRALDVLVSYADALLALAEAGAYDGKDLEPLAKSTAGLVKEIQGGQPSMTTDIISAIGSPLGRIARVLVQEYAENKLTHIITTADPDVQAILTAMERYIGATGDELRDVQRGYATLLNNLDRKIDKDDAAGMIEFHRRALEIEAEMAFAQRAQSTYRSVVEKIKEAQIALRDASVKAEQDQNNADDVKKVLGFADGIVRDAQVLKDVIARRETP